MRKSAKSKKAVKIKVAKKKATALPKKNLKKVKVAPAKIAIKAEAHMLTPRVFITRRIMIWGIAVIMFLAVISTLITEGSSDGKNTSFLQRLPQAATLNLLSSNDPVTVLATGDVMLARYVETLMRKNNDYNYPFKKAADFLKNADITIGNLETPLFQGRTTTTDSMTFRADLKGVQGLLFAGFDIMSLANNHTMNYRVTGLKSTLAALDGAGIKYSGAGLNQDGAHTPTIMEVKGKKIAFYSYNDKSIPPGFHGEATLDIPGIAPMNIEAVKNDVKNALQSADFVIVSMHAGAEYKKQPTQFQKDFAHAAIDAGASVVIGSHPHVVEPVENYRDGVIFYSLGNFVFDQFFSPDVQTGLVAKITLEAGEKPAYELFPVKIDKTQPRILEGDEKAQTLKALGF